MIELFPSLLTLDQVEQLHASAAAAHWFEGAATARGDAKKIKQCQTAELPTDSTLAGIVRSIVNAPELRPFCPRRMTSPRLMRYSVADFYGPHADLISDQQTGTRLDFSLTVMLQPAARGGELVIEGRARQLLAGDCIVYPSTTLHQVAPVLEGQRLAMVAWLESVVRDSDQRRVLHELDELARGELDATPARMRSLHQELLRQWMG